eukprot:Awhi_evm1s664
MFSLSFCLKNSFQSSRPKTTCSILFTFNKLTRKYHSSARILNEAQSFHQPQKYNESEYIRKVDKILESKGWVLDTDNPLKNAFKEYMLPSQRLRADYVLKNEDKSILAVIEVKRQVSDLMAGLEQAKRYCEKLEDVKVAFATD